MLLGELVLVLGRVMGVTGAVMQLARPLELFVMLALCSVVSVSVMHRNSSVRSDWQINRMMRSNMVPSVLMLRGPLKLLVMMVETLCLKMIFTRVELILLVEDAIILVCRVSTSSMTASKAILLTIVVAFVLS